MEIEEPSQDENPDDGEEESDGGEEEPDAEEDNGDEENRRRRKVQTVEETETETSYEVVFTKVVEYRKPNGAVAGRRLTAAEQAYDWETDEVVSEINLSDWTGFTPVESTRRRLQNGVEGTVYTFSLSTFDNLATFDFTIAQAGGLNPAVTSNTMKIDVTLSNYPYSAPDTYLALMSNVESEREVEIEYSDEDESEDDADGSDGSDEMDGDSRRRRRLSREPEQVKISFDDALTTTGIRPFGEFSWAKEAIVFAPTGREIPPLDNSTEPEISLMQTESAGNETESATIQVVGTSPQDGTDRLAFSFVGSDAARNAETIYWDPEAGIGYERSLGASAAVSLSSGMAIVAATALAVVGMFI